MPLKTIDEILDYYRAEARSKTALGNAFEKFGRAFLRHDPVQKGEFKNIQTYRQWSGRSDKGIDIVAELTDGTGFAAIQCKCWEEDATIDLGALSTFLALSANKKFARRVVIDTTATKWSSNLNDFLEDDEIPITRIGLDKLRKSPLVWEKFDLKDPIGTMTAKQPRPPLPHQEKAIEDVLAGFADGDDRGKLIMACGTGKTFTALQIAKELVGKGGRVLYVMPSLALMAQTIREWANDAPNLLRSFAVCSDDQVGRRESDDDDIMQMDESDLEIPATTDANRLVNKAKANVADKMTVIYSTYQSIQVLKDAQNLGLPDFDLIICDEAHRTAGEESKAFGMINEDKNVRGKKRLYMTATPIIFSEKVKRTAEDKAIKLYSMDNEKIYGRAFHTLNFGEAVSEKLLTDYRVIVFGVDENLVKESSEKEILSSGRELDLSDENKIVGCYKTLLKQNDDDEIEFVDPDKPMQRVIAFCNSINASKAVTGEFERIVDGYHADLAAKGKTDRNDLECKLRHVDGSFDAKSRNVILEWLEADPADNECRILSNVRCLSEGVDVPALDAIALLHPRKSQIDVVQCVGRVMRKAPDKNMGYVILPIVIPPDKSPEDALDDNEKYRVVWETLNAIRSHDEKFLQDINNLNFSDSDRNKDTRIQFMALGKDAAGNPVVKQMKFVYNEFTDAIKPRIVKKCGDLTYWDKKMKSDSEKVADAIIEATWRLRDEKS